jgi:arginase family enzyme
VRARRLWFDLHDDAVAAPRVAVIGLPFDGAVSLRPGASSGPEGLRRVSLYADPVTRRGKAVPRGILRDYGDVTPAPWAEETSGPEATRTYLAEVAARVGALPPEAFVLAIGGDNSVTIGTLEAFGARHGANIGVIWFDAHPDLFETYDGQRDSHATALREGMRRSGIRPEHVVLLGARSFADAELAFIRSAGVELVTAADWMESGAGAVADRIVQRLGGCSAVYLAVDVDGFDAGAAPGTGYPTPGGPPSEAFFVLQEQLFQRLRIRAMDITEIAPPLDTNDMTSFLGAQIVLEATALVATS